MAQVFISFACYFMELGWLGFDFILILCVFVLFAVFDWKVESVSACDFAVSPFPISKECSYTLPKSSCKS